jgi:hypothetical protein
MARHRLPTSVLEASGAFDHDPQRREARENEPVPSGPLGDPPLGFDDGQRVVWEELACQAAPGVLTIADRILVEMGARLITRLRRGEPLKAAEQNLILSILARMGMTPSDRSRIAAPPPEKEHSEDTFSRLARSGRAARPTETKQ